MGPTGKNFAAGMSGGIAYVLDEGNDLYKRLNKEMVSSSEITSKYDVLELKSMIQEHVALTNSARVRKCWITLESICLSSRRSSLMTMRES